LGALLKNDNQKLLLGVADRNSNYWQLYLRKGRVSYRKEFTGRTCILQKGRESSDMASFGAMIKSLRQFFADNYLPNVLKIPPHNSAVIANCS